jgi:hypothetical protein
MGNDEDLGAHGAEDVYGQTRHQFSNHVCIVPRSASASPMNHS